MQNYLQIIPKITSQKEVIFVLEIGHDDVSGKKDDGMFEKLFRMKQVMTAAFMMALPCSAMAATTVSVSLGDSIRPVTHVASGSLYGFTETLPSNVDADVAPLNPNVFLAPARSGSGRQQGIGGAFLISPRLKNTTGKVQIRLADILPGWPYQYKNWDHWKSEVTSVVNDKKSAAVQNFDGYEIWNEPNDTWKGSNNFEADLWKPTYQLLRQLDPDAKIIGPSYSYYNSSRMESFLKYCVENNVVPDVISWHQWGSEGFVGALENYRALEKKYNISPRKVSINEYSHSKHELEGNPGVSVPFIAKFERHGVESAMISWWFVPLPGRLGSLLTKNNERGGGWHLYKWYGDMSGYMAKVTPPNDKSDGVDGFAAVDSKKKFASIVVGGNTLGNVDVKIDKIPEFLGSKVDVSVEYVTWEDKDKAVPSTTPESSKEYTVNNGSITVPIDIKNVYNAYRIYITPIIPQAPYGDKAVSIPGKIEFENYDVGGEGKAYHDDDYENKGGEYRDDGVDIVKAADGGLALGYTTAGEWMEYTFNVEADGEYDVTANVSTAMETAGFILYVDEKQVLDSINVAQIDESFDVYKELKLGSLPLTKGEHVLKVQITKSYINLDWIKFASPAVETPMDSVPEEPKDTTPDFFLARLQVTGPTSYGVFDLQGNLLGHVSGQGLQELNVKTANLVNHSGIYLLRSKKGGKMLKMSVSK